MSASPNPLGWQASAFCGASGSHEDQHAPDQSQTSCRLSSRDADRRDHRAAVMVHLTQPAVSRLIKDFEASLGLKLFERSGSGIAPTREAHIIFAEVERLFSGLDRLMQLAVELRQSLNSR